MQYGAWQPISTDLTSIGTKAPYYGSITVAAALGDRPATVVEIPLDSQISGADLQPEAAYAIYTSGTSLSPSPFSTSLPVSLVNEMQSLRPLPPIPPPIYTPPFLHAFLVSGPLSPLELPHPN
jgi:hypothetical protein